MRNEPKKAPCSIALLAHVQAGSIVIATGACREDGVTEKMLPLSYPALADVDVVCALRDSARKNGVDAACGVVLTQALFYPSFLESTVKLYAKAGVVAMENEVASLLVVASTHGVKAGAILTADAPAFELVGPEGYQPDMEMVNRSVNAQIKIALDALAALEIDE